VSDSFLSTRKSYHRRMYTLARTEDLYPMAHETMHGHENARMLSTGVSRRLERSSLSVSQASFTSTHHFYKFCRGT
jgi:hypothetical protein